MKSSLLDNRTIIFVLCSLPIAFIYARICIKRPFWVIAALAVYTPLEQFVSKWFPDILYTPLRYVGEATIFFLFCVYLVDRVIVKKRWTKTPIDRPILILLAAIVLSALANRVPFVVAVLGTKNLLRYIALFYLTILARPSHKQIKGLCKVLFVMAILQAGLALLQAAVGKPAYDLLSAREVTIGTQLIRPAAGDKLAFGSYRTMVFGTMERYNILGNYLAMWLGIAFAALVFKSRILGVRLWHLGLMSGALVLSYSRMSWVALMAGLVVLFALSKRIKFVSFLLVFSIVVSTFGLYALAAGDIDIKAVDVGLGNPLTRYLSSFSPEYIEILFRAGRGYGYFTILPAVLHISPLFGLGPGMIASDVSSLVSIPPPTDRLALDHPAALRYLGDAGFATVVAQMGMLGGVAVVLVFVQLFRFALRSLRSDNGEWRSFAVGYAVIVVMMVVFNLLSFALIYRVPSYYFWMFSAFAVLMQGDGTLKQSTFHLRT